MVEKKQTKISKSNSDVKLLMHSESSFGFGLNTNGYTLAYNKTKIIHFTKKKYWEIEFSKIKSERETKTEPTDFSGYENLSPKKYIFGKRNSLFVFELRKGLNYKLTQKSAKNGIEISWNTSIGGTLALLKPYYLVVKRLQNDSLVYTEEKYSESNADVFLNKDGLNHIYGYSGFWKGFFETIPLPACNFRIGLNFDWASYDDNISSLEVGVKANLFLINIPIMANKSNHQFYPCFFAIYKIGERKY